MKRRSEEADDSREDREKILAFAILLLAYLSVPSLLFALVLAMMVNVSYLASLYHTGDWVSIIMVTLLTVLNLCFIVSLKIVIKWLRS